MDVFLSNAIMLRTTQRLGGGICSFRDFRFTSMLEI